MMIVVERTERLVPFDRQSKSLRDSLNGEFAKLLKLDSIQTFFTCLPFYFFTVKRYSLVLVYSPVCSE